MWATLYSPLREGRVLCYAMAQTMMTTAAVASVTSASNEFFSERLRGAVKCLAARGETR